MEYAGVGRITGFREKKIKDQYELAQQCVTEQTGITRNTSILKKKETTNHDYVIGNFALS